MKTLKSSVKRMLAVSLCACLLSANTGLAQILVHPMPEVFSGIDSPSDPLGTRPDAASGKTLNDPFNLQPSAALQEEPLSLVSPAESVGLSTQREESDVTAGTDQQPEEEDTPRQQEEKPRSLLLRLKKALQMGAEGLFEGSGRSPAAGDKFSASADRQEEPMVLPGDPQTSSEVAAALSKFIRDNPAKFGGISLDSLALLSAQQVEGREGLSDTLYVNYQQHINGTLIEGSHLSFTVKLLDGRALVVSSTAQLYPNISVETAEGLKEEDLLTRALAKLGPGSAPNHLTRLERRVLHADGRWRTMELLHAHRKGLLIAVDIHTGEAFAWDLRSPLGTPEGSVGGRGVLFDPVKTGKNLVELPLAHVEIKTSQGKTFYSDEQGHFTVEGNGKAPVTLTVRLHGRYASVKTDPGAGEDLVITRQAKPGERLQLTLNPGGYDEFSIAQVNAYYHVTRTHQFLKDHGVSHPNIDGPILVQVNQDDDCNAFYNYFSLHFFRSSFRCHNTSYDTVNTHEYGHHWDMTATGRRGAAPAHAMMRLMAQSGISEGWGDILAMFITGQPVIGEGFFKDDRKNNYIRHGENTYQYLPTDEVHRTGQAWMGFAWKLRKALIASMGEAAGAALASALILPVVFTGTRDIPTAIQEVLLRDTGPDGKTPHFAQIQAAAKAHGILIKAARRRPLG